MSVDDVILLVVIIGLIVVGERITHWVIQRLRGKK